MYSTDVLSFVLQWGIQYLKISHNRKIHFGVLLVRFTEDTVVRRFTPRTHNFLHSTCTVFSHDQINHGPFYPYRFDCQLYL